MYIKITDIKEKEWLLGKYSYNIKLRSLKAFAKKSGYGDGGGGYMGIYFKADLEEDPYEFQQELSEINDNQIVLFANYPTTISDDKDAEEVVYLTFDEFYDYLVEVVDERIAETPSDKAEYEQLLSEVKIALGL
ncbi:hypothetical protein FACS1894192_03940 [Bacilli bacterium]|nr:hypothetical protein FACS1894192_03940 [Bacilli bacterium]